MLRSYLLALWCVALAAPLAAERIEILRDKYGVPHIFAQTLAGAAYASGYAQASDRPRQLIGRLKPAKVAAVALAVDAISKAFVAGVNARFVEDKRPERISPEQLPTDPDFDIDVELSIAAERSSSGLPLLIYTTRGKPAEQPYEMEVVAPKLAAAGLMGVGSIFPRPLPAGSLPGASLIVDDTRRRAILEALLARSTKFSLETVVQVVLSTDVYKAETWLTRIARTEQRTAFANSLISWDRRASYNSMPALGFYLFKLALGAEGSEIEPPGSLSDGRIRAALDRAGQRAETDIGLQGGFGSIFRIPGERTSWPVGGGTIPEAGIYTARGFTFGSGQPRRVQEGQTGVFAVELSKPHRVLTALALGVSEDPGSPHYGDQARDLFGKGTLEPVTYPTRSELNKHAHERKTLTYALSRP